MHPGKILENASGLFAYEPHRIDIMADESHHPDFLALNPNGKIPAIYDPNGPSGTPLALFESGAMAARQLSGRACYRRRPLFRQG
jgi:GST-like protein